MQKSKNLLLVLSSEEREEAQAFVKRRLKTLAPESATELQTLSQMSRQIVRRLKLDKSQYARSPSRAGKLMAKLHDVALVDIQSMIQDLDQAIYALQSHAPPPKGEEEEGHAAETEHQDESLIITCAPEETRHAAEIIKDRVENLRLPDLKLFRDACQDILTWWESERGQIESLHMDQAGNINSATGRVAIRQKRDELLKNVFNPFKMFYRHVNMEFQRKSKTASTDAVQRAAQKRKEQSRR